MVKYSIILLFSAMFLCGLNAQGQDCQVFPDTIYAQTNDCSANARVCIPVSSELFRSKKTSTLLDGNMYDNGISGCDFDTSVIYNYLELIGGGESGPYKLTSWEVNDTIYKMDKFEDIPALIDSLNLWDKNGNWIHDPKRSNSNIKGGDLKNTYGDMVIEQVLLPGVFTSLGPIRSVTALSTVIYVEPKDAHEFIFIDSLQNCKDTTTIVVQCVHTDTIDVDVYVGLAGKTCLPTNELLGEVVSVSPCFVDAFNDVAKVTLDNATNCVTYSANKEGQETICYTICDEFGICDTTKIIVNAITPPSSVRIRSVAIGSTINECFQPDNLPGQLTITNLCPTSATYTTNTINEAELCIKVRPKTEVGIDIVCVEVCNQNGVCDTTQFFISVVEPNGVNFTAVEDTIQAYEGQDFFALVLKNDDIKNVSSLFILNQPNEGEASVTKDSIIVYKSAEGYCGADEFQYAVCNATGCDTATVKVSVLCDEVKVYNAFSPNKDGLNDVFTIDGLELYPNARVTVVNIWGNIVYQNINPAPSNGSPDFLPYNEQTAWDGTWAGKNVPDGNYFYTIELNDGSGKVMSGYVYLFR